MGEAISCVSGRFLLLQQPEKELNRIFPLFRGVFCSAIADKLVAELHDNKKEVEIGFRARYNY